LWNDPGLLVVDTCLIPIIANQSPVIYCHERKPKLQQPTMKLFLTLALFIFCRQVIAQDCSCAAQLNFVITYFEQNNPAFQKIKNDPGSYKASVKKLQTAAKKEKDTDLCIRVLDNYVTLLKDHHSGIGFNLKRKDLGDSTKVAAFKSSDAYKGFKKLQADTIDVINRLSAKSISDIEGYLQ
jgi:hypothetical protein